MLRRMPLVLLAVLALASFTGCVLDVSTGDSGEGDTSSSLDPGDEAWTDASAAVETARSQIGISAADLTACARTAAGTGAPLGALDDCLDRAQHAARAAQILQSMLPEPSSTMSPPQVQLLLATRTQLTALRAPSLSTCAQPGPECGAEFQLFQAAMESIAQTLDRWPTPRAG